MRIVVDLLGFVEGKTYGFQEYLLNLLDGFSSHTDVVTAESITLLVNESEKPFFESRYGDTFKYDAYAVSGALGLLFREKKIIDSMDLKADDVLLFTRNTMPFTKSKAKKVLVFHDLLYRHRSFFAKTLYYLLFRIQRYVFVPYSIRKADKVIAISECTKNEIVEAYRTSSEKIDVIYNFFNFNKYSDVTPTEKSLVNGKYILSICADYKHKNHITLLKAFELFCEKESGYFLVFIGGLSQEAKHYYEKMPEYVRSKVIIRKHLSTGDIKAMYENASLFVSASLYEGLGMPVVEALYFGLPTVVSDIPIHHEVSLNKAVYYNALCQKELSEKMLENVHRCINVDEGFRVSLTERYNEQNTLMKYIEVLNTIVR